MKLVTFEVQEAVGAQRRLGALVDSERIVDLSCTLRVNGVVWMEGNASNMHHTFGAMIERASQDSRIVPADVVATGTVGGGSIGEGVRKGYPARWLQPADTVKIEVEGIGTLRNMLGAVTNPNRNPRLTAPSARPMPEPLSTEELQRVRERTAPPARVNA